MFRFADPYYFWLLALIPLFTLAFAWFLVWRKRAISRYGDRAVIRGLMPEASTPKMVLKFAFLMVALAFLVLTIAGPQTGSRIEKVKRTGIDLIIALDVSNSMMAEDIKPNRLERAKQAISRLIDRLDGDRIGIIVFAGKAYTQLPITTDYAAAKMFISAINTSVVPVQGTAVGDAIELAVKNFGASKNNKALIIITDGEDHQGSVLEQAENATQQGVILYTIGMGLPEGAPIPIYNGNVMTGFRKDGEGNPIVSRLDETLLQQLATIGKGMYVRASNSETGLKQIFDDLNKIQASEIETKQFSDYEARFQYFLALTLLILIIDLFVFERKTFWLKKIKPFSLLLILLLPAGLVFGQSEPSLIRKGNNLYEKNDYPGAEKDYRKALELNKESMKGKFNLGTAIYQQKNFKESAELYRSMAGNKYDKDVLSKVYHNLGNSLLESKEYEKSIQAYKNALIHDPSDMDSKYNLEYARALLKKQQQQQQQQNKDQQNDKKDQQNQNQQNQNQQNQPPDQKKISKEDANRMLEAMKNDEKKTMEKVNKQKGKAVKVQVEKDW